MGPRRSVGAFRFTAILLSAVVISGSVPASARAGSRAAPAEPPPVAARPVQATSPHRDSSAAPIPTFGRLYYTGITRTTGGAPAVTRDASWTGTYGLTSQRMLSVTPSGSLNGGGNTANSMPTPSNAFMQQYFYRLPNAGTLAGYVRSIVRAARRDGIAIGDNQKHQAQMVIRVVSGDGTTVRGTALGAHEPTSVDSAYFAPDYTARQFPASVTWLGNIGAPLTPVDYQAGDWMVVELGTRAIVQDQGMGTALSVNDTAASDLPVNETETANLRSWIEILPPGSADEWLLGAGESPHGKKTGRLESDPVNTATGNYVSTVTDLAMPGMGLPFAFTRTYNSLAYRAPDPVPPPNLVRVPKGGTAGYAAISSYSAVYAPQYAADGQASNTSGGYSTWAVSGWESGDWWQVTWSQPQAVDRVVLCDRRASGYYFGSSGRLTFSDGSTVNWSGLPNDCGATGTNTLTINFPRKTGITWMRVIGDTGGQGNAGLAEVFAYDIDAPNAEVRDYPSSLGVGWTHSYAANLAFAAPSGQVTFTAEDGSQIRFAPDGSGGYVAPPNIVSTLASVAGGGYKLTRRDQVVYAFDASGRLTSLSDRNGNELTYGYTGGKLTSITDTVGRTVTLAYTGNRLTSLSAPPGRTVTYAYDTLNRLASVTDARGETWTYGYDAKHHLESLTDPNGHVVVTNEYGTNGRVSAQTNATGDRGTFAWDPASQTSTYTDANDGEWIDIYATNVLQSSSDPLGNTTSYAYDADFNVTDITDPLGHTKTMTYDGAGNLLTRSAPTPLSYVETWTYTAFNDVDTYTDGRSHTTDYVYDTAGNLISIAAPLSAVTEFGRDTAGTGLLVSLTDPRDKVTTFGYDTSANLTSVTTPLGNQTTMTYDSAGRLLTVVDPRGNVSGGTPADYTTTFTYDASDRRATATDPLGNVTTNAYDEAGNLASVTDANTHTTAYGYDAANNLTSVTDAATEVTAYAYDNVGNLVTRTDPNDHVTTYTYDGANHLETTTDPMSNIWSLTYDPAGNVSTRTDAKLNTTTYVYDALNRLTGITYASPSTPAVTFAYDANSDLTTMTDGAGTETYVYDDLDRLTTVTRGSNTFAYGYDLAGNLTSRTYPGQSAQAVTYDDDGRLLTANGASYAYDPAANLVSVATPDGLTARYTHDRAGRLLEVAHTSSSDTLSRFTYALDPAGSRTAMTTREGTVTYRYDVLDRLTEACWSAATCPGGAPASPLACLACVGGLATRPAATPPPLGETYRTYAYDPVGNRLSEASDGGGTTYAYDAADRLISVTPPGQSAVSYTFDNNGNQTAAGADSFTWDLADRLVSAAVSGTTETYTWAGDGRRLSASTGGATTNFLWDRAFGLPQLALERDGSGGLLRSYRYGLNLLSQTSGASTAWYHNDGLGSVSDMTDAAGTSLSWSEFYPYGVTRVAGSSPGAPGVQPFAFSGEQRDPVTNLYHLRTRQFDPFTGRFLSSDPLGYASRDPNLFSYARCNPVNRIDPSGLVSEEGGGFGGGSSMAGGGGSGSFGGGPGRPFLRPEDLVPCNGYKFFSSIGHSIVAGVTIGLIPPAELASLGAATPVAVFGVGIAMIEGAQAGIDMYDAYHCE